MSDDLDVITLDEAKQALNISDTDDTFDAEVGAYVTAVSRRLDDLAGPIVARTVSAEPHDGGSGLIFPRHTPVVSVTTVVEHTSGTAATLTGETVTALPASGWLLEAAGTHGARLRRRSSGSDSHFPAGRGNVLVTYVAGRYTDVVDAKFKLAATIMLNHMWRREQGGGSATFGPYEEGRAGIPTFGTPNAVMDLLAAELAPGVSIA